MQGLFPLSLSQMLSSYKSKYDDIDWIVDTLIQPLPCNLLSISTRNVLDHQLSCFELSLLMMPMPRMPG